MDNPYDLRSWSLLYREDVLREARKRQLAELTRTDGWMRSARSRVVLACKRVLSGLRPGLRRTPASREPEPSRW